MVLQPDNLVRDAFLKKLRNLIKAHSSFSEQENEEEKNITHLAIIFLSRKNLRCNVSWCANSWFWLRMQDRGLEDQNEYAKFVYWFEISVPILVVIYLGISKITYLKAWGCAAIQKGVFKLEITMAYLLQKVKKDSSLQHATCLIIIIKCRMAFRLCFYNQLLPNLTFSRNPGLSPTFLQKLTLFLIIHYECMQSRQA